MVAKGLEARLRKIVDTPFVRITYTAAVATLKGAKWKALLECEWGTDLESEHEKFLTDAVHDGPVAVYNYPKSFKAFYMRTNDPGTDGAPGETVAACDLLVPGIGELIGGSQR